MAPLDYKPRPAWESRTDAEAAMAAARGETPLANCPQSRPLAKGWRPPRRNYSAVVQAWPSPRRRSAGSKHRQAVARDGKLNPNLKNNDRMGQRPGENRGLVIPLRTQARLNAMGVRTMCSIRSAGTSRHLLRGSRRS